MISLYQTRQTYQNSCPLDRCMTSDFPQRLAEYLGRARAQGLTQASLARDLQVSKQTMQAWRQGKNPPPLDKAAQLARALGVSLDELAGLSQPAASAHASAAEALVIELASTGLAEALARLDRDDEQLDLVAPDLMSVLRKAQRLTAELEARIAIA